MAKKGVIGDVVKKSKNLVSNIATGVGKFVGSVVPKMTRKTRKSRRSRKMRKSRK